MARSNRKNKYELFVKPRFDDIREWRQNGVSEKQIAENLGIARSTFFGYIEKYPELQELLEESTGKLKNNLKKSLYKECLGYTYEEVKTVCEDMTWGKKEKTEKVVKYARPQPNLLIFALCNLIPEEFKRVDKELMEDLEEKIIKRVEFNSDVFQQAYEKIYPRPKELKESKKEVGSNESNNSKK